MKSDFAFILGNGTTRLQVDCEKLLSKGFVYGCNKIYEEFSPHVLVSTDAGMSNEIQSSNYSKSNIHYLRKENKQKNSGSHILPKNIHNWSSGPSALGLACMKEQNYLFLIGFDFKGINNKINNIYAGKENYLSKDSDATFYGNWINQIESLIENHPGKRFMQVNPLDNFTPIDFKKYKNFETITLDVFYSMINT